jgi:hypothetical protein
MILCAPHVSEPSTFDSRADDMKPKQPTRIRLAVSAGHWARSRRQAACLWTALAPGRGGYEIAYFADLRPVYLPGSTVQERGGYVKSTRRHRPFT